MKVVILAGGKGTRLGLTDRPKPMVDLAGRPVLQHLVELAVSAGFQDFLFLNGHLAEVIEDHFGDGSRFGARISHVREPSPVGTAGAVRDVRRLLTEPFLVLYGDIYSDIDLRHFAHFAESKGGIGAVFVHPNDHPHDSDLVEVDDSGRITRFHPKPHAEGTVLPNLVSGAIYVLTPEAIDAIPPEGSWDWGRDILPIMAQAGGRPLYAYRSIEYSKDIGTPDRLKKVEMDLASGRVARLSRRSPKPAIFFDRDGVLNYDEGGVHSAGEMRLIEGVGAAVRSVNRAGIPAICVTNQPDIAKGKFTLDDLRGVFAALDAGLAKEGGYLDDEFFCPHHPDAGWPGEVAELKIKCNCRKPEPGMLMAAAEFHNLDLSRSWIIGDKYCDIAAGKAVGAKGVLVQTGEAGSDAAKFNISADYVASDAAAAVKYILEQMK